MTANSAKAVLWELTPRNAFGKKDTADSSTGNANYSADVHVFKKGDQVCCANCGTMSTRENGEPAA